MKGKWLGFKENTQLNHVHTNYLPQYKADKRKMPRLGVYNLYCFMIKAMEVCVVTRPQKETHLHAFPKVLLEL